MTLRKLATVLALAVVMLIAAPWFRLAIVGPADRHYGRQS